MYLCLSKLYVGVYVSEKLLYNYTSSEVKNLICNLEAIQYRVTYYVYILYSFSAFFMFVTVLSSSSLRACNFWFIGDIIGMRGFKSDRHIRTSPRGRVKSNAIRQIMVSAQLKLRLFLAEAESAAETRF